MSQEFHFQLEQKQLHAGIKRHSGGIVPAVDELYNVEVTETGLVPYSPLTLLGTFTPDWPFPWLKGGAGKMLTISPVNTTTAQLDMWEGEVDTYITDITLPSFGIADLPDMAVFDTYRVITGTFGVLDGIGNNLTSTTNIPKARSCCNYKGQLILGGILGDWHDCDESFVAWSNIGDVTMLPDWKNEAGYRPINFVEKVYRVRRLGDLVAVYGSNGVVFLSGVASPAPTLGMKEVAKIKLASMAAVDGGLRYHIAVDSSGYVWQVTQEGAERLGYKDAMSNLTLSDVVVSYDEVNNRNYISDGARCFLLTDAGLCEVYQIVSGAAGYYGVGYFVGDEGLETYKMIAGPFDFGYQSLKTVYTVESDTGDEVGVQVLINGTYTLIKTVPLNNVGIVTPVISGKSFKIVITGDDYNVYPNHILLRWKMSDLRGVRGYIQPRQS